MSLPPTKDLLFRSLPKGGIMSNLKQELMLSSCLIDKQLVFQTDESTCSYCMFVFGMSDTSRCDCTAIFFNC